MQLDATPQGPFAPSTAARAHVDPGIALLAALLIPVAIVAYYIEFIYTLYMAGLIAFAAVVFANWRGTRLHLRAFLPLLLVYLWWWVTVLWTPSGDAVFYAAVAGVYVTTAVLAGPLKMRFGPDFALRVIMYCGAAYAVCALISLVEVGSFIDESKGSVRTIFSAFFIAATPAAVYFTIERKSPIAAICLVLMTAIGFQLESRTFILVYVPAVLLTLVILARSTRFFQMARLPLGVLGAIVAIASAIVLVSTAGNDLFGTIGRQTSFAVDEGTFWEAQTPQMAAADLERRLLVVVGLDSFHRHPVVGAGYWSTPYYMGEYYHSELTAHGFPFFLLGETGLIGTALFLWALAASIRGYLRQRRLLPPTDATLVYVELVTLLAIIAVGLFHQVYNDFYLYLFMGIGMWRLAEANRRGGAGRAAYAVRFAE